MSSLFTKLGVVGSLRYTHGMELRKMLHAACLERQELAASCEVIPREHAAANTAVALVRLSTGSGEEHVMIDESVRNMDASLLVVHDTQDREVPFDRGATIAASWPGAVLHRTEGLGHRRILRDPEVVRIVDRFVAYGRTP